MKKIEIRFIDNNNGFYIISHEYEKEIEFIGNPPTLLKIKDKDKAVHYYPINLIENFVTSEVEKDG